MMRTTLTLDDDVAAKLKAQMRRSGESFRQTVNRFLRLGLNARVVKPTKRFVVRARPLGAKPGVSYDNVWELVAQLDEADRS